MKRVALITVCAALCGCSAVANYPIIATVPKAAASPMVTACPAMPQNTSRVGFGASGIQAITAVEQLTGVRAAWALEYPEFGDAFDAATACQYSEIGATPIIQIDPYDTSLASIADGSQDAYLRSYAEAVRAFRAPVILSLGHEMNGNWYPWGWTHARPAMFVAAWRRMVTIFRQQGATNVTWMWTVSLDRPGSTVAVSPAAWWPGAQYVQMVGIDAYFRYPADTWDAVFGTILAQVRALTSDQVLASETGVEQDVNSYSQTMQLFQGVEQNHLAGLVWFNEKASRDWQLQDDPAALAAFKQDAPAYEHATGGSP